MTKVSNKDKVQKRLDQLMIDRENSRNNYMAIEGAIADCQYWLTEFAD